MADTIVEFINASGKTLTDLQAGVTVVANAANEQAVVKDVIITSSKGRRLALEVGGAVVAEVSGAAKLTGSELLGANQQMTLKTIEVALLNNYFTLSGVLIAKNGFETVFSGDQGAKQIAAGSTATVASLTETPNFICFAANGDFYYSAANAENSPLRRRAGGVTGAETSFADFGFAVCYDGSRYIYGIKTSQIQTLDTHTGTIVATKTLSGVTTAPNPSYAHACTIDGWVWLRPDNAQCFLVNPATGQGYPLGGRGSTSAQQYMVGCGKDLDGNYVFIMTDHTAPNLYWYSPGKTLGANPVVRRSGSASISLPEHASVANKLHRSQSSGNYVFFVGNGRVVGIDLTAIATTVNLTTSGGTDAGGCTFIGALDAAKASDDFGTVGIRATGIKITP